MAISHLVASGLRVLSLTGEPAVRIEGGRLEWIPVRRRLGIGAFGTNAYRAASAGDQVIEDHVESPGQEELYVVVSGSMRFTAGEDEVDLTTGAAVFVSDPTLRRVGVALEDNTLVLAVGGWRDRPYHSLPWEPIFLAQESMLAGDWAAAAATLKREAGEHLGTGIVQFRLACCHAQLGEHELAMEELRAALEASPGLRERAQTDDLLAPLRDVDGFPPGG